MSNTLQEDTTLSPRLVLAGNIATGLLASQDREKGWNIDALAVVSLRVADSILHYSEQETLPELTKPE